MSLNLSTASPVLLPQYAELVTASTGVERPGIDLYGEKQGTMPYHRRLNMETRERNLTEQATNLLAIIRTAATSRETLEAARQYWALEQALLSLDQ